MFAKGHGKIDMPPSFLLWSIYRVKPIFALFLDVFYTFSSRQYLWTVLPTRFEEDTIAIGSLAAQNSAETVNIFGLFEVAENRHKTHLCLGVL